MRMRAAALLIVTTSLTCATTRGDGPENAASAFLQAVCAEDWKRCSELLDTSALIELQDKVVVLAKRHEQIDGAAESMRTRSPDSFFAEYASLNSDHFHRWIGCTAGADVEVIDSQLEGTDWRVRFSTSSGTNIDGAGKQLFVRDSEAGWRVLLPPGVSSALQALIDAGV